MQKDLTTGSVFKNVLYFSLPYLLSYFLQTLYGMADLFIIGQFEGTASITAVSIGSQIMHMITVMLVGLAMGVTVGIGRAVGAHDDRDVGAVIGNAVMLFLAVSVALAAVLTALVQPILSHHVHPGRGCARRGGLPDHLLHRHPLYYGVQYHCVHLPRAGRFPQPDVLYRGGLRGQHRAGLLCLWGRCGMGPAGAALGTTLSQGISVIVSLGVILQAEKRRPAAQKRPPAPESRHWPHPAHRRTGGPAGRPDPDRRLLLITVIANRRGLTDAAAVGIVEKVISFLFLVPSSMLSTASALGAQNVGAGKPERAVQDPAGTPSAIAAGLWR